jgi:hypothetical protein
MSHFNERRKFERFAVQGRYLDGHGQMVSGLISLSANGLSVYLDEQTIKTTALGLTLDYPIEIFGQRWVLPVRVVRKIGPNRLVLELNLDRFEYRTQWLNFLEHHRLL